MSNLFLNPFFSFIVINYVILSRLESTTGECIWSKDVGGSVLATPVLVDNEGRKNEQFWLN